MPWLGVAQDPVGLWRRPQTQNRTLSPPMTRSVVAVLLVAGLVCASIVASALGWFGGVVSCGADRAPGCVIWPAPVTYVVWAAFVIGVAALLVWQVRYLDR
jgi:hypothetical protein